MQQPGPKVYVVVDKDRKDNRFAKKTAKGLSITQITLGATSILSQILLILLASLYPSRSGYYDYENIAGIGEGIYCGVFFVIAGSLGLLASRKPSNCNISAFMTLSILAAIFSAVQISVASVNLTSLVVGYRAQAVGVKIGLFSAMIMSGLGEFVVSIICAAVCCRACCCSGGGPARGQVVYLSQGEATDQSLEGANAQIPVQMGYIPQTIVGGLEQKQSELPSYGDVVHEELEVKETQTNKSGGYERF